MPVQILSSSDSTEGIPFFSRSGSIRGLWVASYCRALFKVDAPPCYYEVDDSGLELDQDRPDARPPIMGGGLDLPGSPPMPGPGQVAIRPYLSDGPTSWPGASLPRWSRPGARFQRQACRTFGAYRDFAGALGRPQPDAGDTRPGSGLVGPGHFRCSDRVPKTGVCERHFSRDKP